MTQRDFEHISSVIEKKAGIVISSTTIKRLSKGEFSRLPQVATLNAIANYFGFTNWQEYKASDESVSKETTLTEKTRLNDWQQRLNGHCHDLYWDY